MARLVDDLAEEAASAALPTLLKTAPLQIQDAVSHAADAMRPTLNQRGQRLAVTVPGTPITIEADAHRVNQILVNLLSNASTGGLQNDWPA